MNDWPEMIDRQILVDLHQHGPDYIPLIANRRGIHRKTVRRRCEQLADDSYLKKVTEEAVFRITEDGEAELADMHGTSVATMERIGNVYSDE